MRTDLPGELAEALAAMTPADVRELERRGISRLTQYKMVGIARIVSVSDTRLYEPDESGVWAYITPVRVEHAATPESRLPDAAPRIGRIIDLISWDERTPGQWRQRTGLAEWLGAVPPQYLDPGPVRVRRSPLSWLRADCDGIVPLSCDPAAAYSMLMGFAGGIEAEDEVHAAALRRALRRPWPIPSIYAQPVRMSDAQR